MNKRILILCPFPEGEAAGQRLKYEQYFSSWKDEGYNIDISSFSDQSLWKILYKERNLGKKILGAIKGYLRRVKDLFMISNYDIVYIFMWVTPDGSTLFERTVRSLSKVLVYDFDDSIHIEQNKKTSFFLKIFKSNKKSNYLIENSDHVIISSPFHAEYCSNLNYRNKCTYIPCSLNTGRFTIKEKKDTREKIVIGWTGTFSSKVYLDTLREVFIELSKRYDYVLKVIGNFDYELNGVNLEVIKWKKKTEIEDLHTFDIGVYPLIKDQWALGKGALKAMQYMAIGIPTVATNYGTNPQVIDNNENGILVDSSKEWLEKLEYLILNPNERERIGINARKKIVNYYSVKSLEHLYLEVFRESNNEPV